ncbi:MAG: SpoIVB peptidase S55 domain-containing protein [Bacillota bacterium]
MFKRLSFAFALAVFTVALAVVRAGSPFLSLSEVKPGQKGTGYTVVSGTAVKSFGVEIIGVIKSESGERNFVLVKVSGNVFRESKGIAAGMSGSPVFVSGRLLGAISYAFDRSNPRYGLVTPIEEMLRLWAGESATPKVALAPSSLFCPGLGYAVPVTTPLLVSGRRVPPWLALLERQLGMKAIAVGQTGTPREEASPPLVPGSAVAAVFAQGDYGAVAIGTVTWVEGRRFLAFGHPLANQGAVDYPAAGAYIYRVIANLDMPFKLGVPLGQVGRFVQDRGVGAGGLLEEKADTVTVEAVVEDRATGKRKSFRTLIVREPSLFRPLALAALLEAIDRTLDEYTPGTAQVALSLYADGLEEPLRRENLFYSDKDIAVEALAEVGEAIDLLLENEFQDLTLRKLRLEVVYIPSPLVARVVKATAEKERVRPGEKIRVEVELRPFRRPNIIVPFSLELPANLAPGKLVLTARGGFLPARKEKEEGEEATGLPEFFLKPPASLAEALRAFAERSRNNELILEYLPLPQEMEHEASAPEPVSLVQSCEYVIQGQTQLILEIEPPPANESKPSP